MITIPGRIPIQILPIFWALAIMIGWINSGGSITVMAVWVVIIFISVLIHEFGHALTALAFGQRAQIQLMGMGGVTTREGRRLSAWKEFLIVLNGPMAGLLLAFFAFLSLVMFADSITPFWYGVLELTARANLFWTVLNLLPITPLDGGHLLRIPLERWFGVLGIKISLFISCILALLIGVFFFLISQILMGAVLLMFAFESYRTWKSSLAMSTNDQDDGLQKVLVAAESDLAKGNLDSAKEKLQAIRKSTDHGIIYMTATEHLASILTQQGYYQEALAMLTDLEKNLSGDGLLLLHQLAFSNRDWQLAVTIGDRAYQVYPNSKTALINAMANAMLKNSTPAIGWMQRAIEDGLSDPKSALASKEFDEIRRDRSFQELVQKYR
jgi:Zn-dependent protease